MGLQASNIRDIFQAQETGNRIQDSGFRIQDSGFRSQEQNVRNRTIDKADQQIHSVTPVS
jgi:hypothetical protein